VWESRFDGLQLVANGTVPARMLGDATVRFTAALQVAAAEEKALAEGLPWGDDSESDPDALAEDTQSDLGSPLLFSSSDGNGFRG